MENNTKSGIISFFDSVEEILLVIATRIGPLAAPVAPAYFVYRAVMTHLNPPWYIALLMAIAIECVGIASINTCLMCWSWNNQRSRKKDPIAPFEWAFFLTSLYLVISISLSVGLEISSALVVIAPAAGFVIAVIGYTTLYIAIDLSEWKNEKSLREGKLNIAGQIKELNIKGQKIEDKIKQRENYLLELNNKNNQSKKQDKKTGQKDRAKNKSEELTTKQQGIKQRQKEVIALYKGMTNNELSTHLGVSIGTIKKDKRELGLIKINSVNGNSQG